MGRNIQDACNEAEKAAVAFKILSRWQRAEQKGQKIESENVEHRYEKFAEKTKEKPKGIKSKEKNLINKVRSRKNREKITFLS